MSCLSHISYASKTVIQAVVKLFGFFGITTQVLYGFTSCMIFLPIINKAFQGKKKGNRNETFTVDTIIMQFPSNPIQKHC